MKRYVYVLCLFISFIGLTSCSKNDPAPASPVIGRWELNRGLLAGFPTSSGYNGLAIDLYYFEGVGQTIDVYSDNTFNLNNRNQAVDDETGTWAYTNNTLTLTYDLGGQDTYTYSKNKNVEDLTSTAPISYTLASPTSNTIGVTGTVTPIYRK